MTAEMFRDKTLLVTGGTGSFGHAIVDRFPNTVIGEIRASSRDEAKQDAMRHLYQHAHPEMSDRIKFYIGDVRDVNSVRDAVHGVDYVFHAAECGRPGRLQRVPADKGDLIYDKYFTEGMGERSIQLGEYTSRSTEQLTLEQVKQKLMEVPYMQQELARWKARS